MPTKAEIAKQLEALQAEYESMEDDSDDSLCVETKDGHKVYLTGEQKRKYLKRNGLLFEDEEETEEVEPAKKVAKKTVAKKAVAKVPVKETVEDLEEVLEEEDPADPVTKRSFF